MAIWLEAEIGQFIPREKTEYIRLIIGNAKALEKEQIMEAYTMGESDSDHFEDAPLQYYNQTFIGKK